MRLAVTVDDLPAHGDLIAGMTRMDIVQGLLKTLKDNDVLRPTGSPMGTISTANPTSSMS
jgi:hypothetical protein